MGLTRRRLIASAALAQLFALGWARPAMGQSGSARFAPAAGPYRLTRTVERQLGRAGKLVVARTWALTFTQQARGFGVTGAQTGVTIDAPPVLAPLAQIERERVEEAMFPLLLDGSGVMAARAAGRSDDAVAEAVEAVRARLATQQFTAGDLALASQFMDSLQAAGHSALAAWPLDLFAPGNRSATDRREVALPGGTTGTLTIATTAAADPATGVMQHFERRIDTVVSGLTKTGKERFDLALQT